MADKKSDKNKDAKPGTAATDEPKQNKKKETFFAKLKRWWNHRVGRKYPYRPWIILGGIAVIPLLIGVVTLISPLVGWVRATDGGYVVILLILYGVALGLWPQHTKKLTPAFLIVAAVISIVWWKNTDEPVKEVRKALKMETSPQRHIREAYGPGGEHVLSKRVCVFEAYTPGRRVAWTLTGPGFYLQSLDEDFRIRTFYIGDKQVGPEPFFVDRRTAGRSDFRLGRTSGMLKFCGPDSGSALLIIKKPRF